MRCGEKMENKSPDSSHEYMPMKMNHELMMHQCHAMEPEHIHHGSSPEAALTSPDKMSEMHTEHEQHASQEASHENTGHQMAHADPSGHEQMFR